MEIETPTLNLDNILTRLKAGAFPTAAQYIQLMAKAQAALTTETNIVNITPPVLILGNVHGQFEDLMKIISLGGDPATTKYLFLGNHIDRGKYSVEVLSYVLALKLKYPSNITLLRGNHECEEVSKIYGYKAELDHKYGDVISGRSDEIFTASNALFRSLPIAALINNKVFCVHGGISPHISTLQQIRDIDRNVKIPHEGGLTDLLWADPSAEATEWTKSPRGAGIVFGEVQLKKFLDDNSLSFLIRSHQMIPEGFSYPFGEDKGLLTVYSAANYCRKCNNLGGMVRVKADLTREIITYKSDTVIEEGGVESLKPKATPPTTN